MKTQLTKYISFLLKNVHCFALVTVLIHFNISSSVHAQVHKKQAWDSFNSLPLLGDNVQFSGKNKQVVNNTSLNNLKTGNSTNQLLQSLNTPDNTIADNASITHSENSVFISPVNPDIILNSNNKSPLTPFTFSVSGQFSLDGGVTWLGVVGDLNNSVGDPAVVIGRSGRFYVGYINADLGQSISWSDDGGTWNEVVVEPGIFNLSSIQDKNHLWIDNSPTSIFEGNLYSAWTDFQGGKIIKFSLSTATDNGESWSTPVEISSAVQAGRRNWGVNIQTGPNGEVYACWAIYDQYKATHFEAAIGFAKNLDGGDPSAWDPAERIIPNIKGIHTHPDFGLELSGGKDMRTNSWPVMTVNQQNGDIYIVWTNRGVPCGTLNPSGCNSGDPDIYMIKSSDKGDSWSSPIRVNQDATTRDQWFPWIACDEITGVLVVIYYDSRTDNTQAETFVSISFDGGDTWEDFLISDVPWSGDGFFGFNSYAGDYIGIDISHGKVVPVWSDDRTGNMLAYTQPFTLPCSPDDIILCNDVISGVEVIISNSITVGGPSCNYTITNTANVRMQAVTEIILQDGFVAEGEFFASINLDCGFFPQKNGFTNAGSNNEQNEITKEEAYENEIKEQKEITDKEAFFTIYPNPSTGKFTLTLPTVAANSQLVIYDMLGQVVLKKTLNTEQETINLSSHLKGIYFVKVISGDDMFVDKIVYQ